MRNLLLSIVTLAMLFVCSCEKGEDPTPTTPSEIPTIELKSNLQFCYLESGATTAKLTFKVDEKWEIRFTTYEGEKVDWIKANPVSGSAGVQNVEITIEPNREVDSRLVRADILLKGNEVVRSEIDDILNTYQAVTLSASILQFGYYNLKYGDPVKFKVTSTTRLQALVDEYIEKKGKKYSDLIYLDLDGPLNEVDFEFMHENLNRLKVLDMFHADITEIPNSAFYGHSSLHYVLLPLSLKRIGSYAFCQTELKNCNLFIPPLLEYVGSNAFADTYIGGSIVFPGTRSTIELSAGAFYSEYIATAVFSDGISVMKGDIVSPFYRLSAMRLPASLQSISCGYIGDIDIIYCYPTIPPTTSDRYGLREGTIKALFIPHTTNSLKDNLYVHKDEEDGTKDSHWLGFYSENPEFNKMHDVL